jgi:hypothetical protein
MIIYHGSDVAVPEPKIMAANRLLDFGEGFYTTSDEAFSLLYGSRLYCALDDEKTKVWHYSVEKLFSIFEEEMDTGIMELPEY